MLGPFIHPPAAWVSEEGQGLAEYSLVIVLIAIAVVVALTALGSQVLDLFNTIVSGIGGS